MEKGVSIYAKLLGGKKIAEENALIGDSSKKMAGDVKLADAETGKAGTGYELFQKKQKAALKAGERNNKSFLASSLKTASKVGAGLLLAGAAFVGESLKKGISGQEHEDALKNILKNTHQLHAGVMSQINTTTKASSQSGGFARQEQLTGITQLTGQTKSYTTALKESALATNIARQYGISYAAAVKMVTMANTGSTGRLQKYFGVLQKVTTNIDAVKKEEEGMTKAQKAANKPARDRAALMDKQLMATKALTAGEARAHGATETFSKSTAGTVSNLKNRFSNLAETVGKKLLPTVMNFVAKGVSFITWAVKTKAVLYPLIAVMGLFVAAFAVEKILGFIKAIKASQLALLLFGGEESAITLTSALMWTAITGGIILVVAGVIMMVKHWSAVKQVFSATWSWIKTHWVLLAEILTAPILGPTVFIIAHWKKVLGFFKSFASGVVNIFKGIGGAVADVFKSIINSVIISPINTALHLFHKMYSSVNIPGLPSWPLHDPAIPMLWRGGNIMRSGMAIVGDRGPEALHLPAGARVTPLNPSQRGTGNGLLGSWAGAGEGDLHVHMEVEGRELATAVLKDFKRLAARR